MAYIVNIINIVVFVQIFIIDINGNILRQAPNYFGKYLGSFPPPPKSIHNVKGKVYAVNETTLFIQDFSYDGQGPDAYFWGGSSRNPDISGFIIPDSLGRYTVLKAHHNQNIILTLPRGHTLKTIRWLAVWCRSFTANFGHIEIPPNFEPPKAKNLGPIRELAHGTHADAVIILDAKTLFIRNLHYDGAAPDAFFMVGNGPSPHSRGTKVPDENNSNTKIHGYIGSDVILRLPRGITVFDIEWFSIYCITYRENFGSVKVPKNLNVPPDPTFLTSKVEPFSSCLTIFPGLMQISWEYREPDVYFQLEGKVAEDQYISFGLSGSSERPEMVGADVAVAFYDSSSSRVRVVDYTLRHKSQCAPQSSSGACPDEIIFSGRENLIFLSGSYLNGYLKVVYKRNVITGDVNADQDILPDEYATIVAAMGPVNSKKQAAYHSIKYTKSSDTPIRISFNQAISRSNCTSLHDEPLRSSSMTSAIRAGSWEPVKIKGETVFRAAIGPPGGEKGYKAITGIEPWGRAWWINGHLIPEIHVERGKNYTFIVEGGNDPSFPNQYHPLYITNNREGGGGQNESALNTRNHKVYAGVSFRRGIPDPSPGAGRLCVWKPKTGVDMASQVSSMEEYERTVALDCQSGSAAVFTWTPDKNTPDVVYYQCYTHRNLGWKIIVNSSLITNISCTTIFVTLIIGGLLR